ncbi:hypothetical protein AgCh_006396 [Apium graveolens]
MFTSDTFESFYNLAQSSYHEVRTEYLILRLLDNDELSHHHVNDVKDYFDNYAEHNQEDFDEFSDVDELYISLPLEKVKALEDLVMIPHGLVKVEFFDEKLQDNSYWAKYFSISNSLQSGAEIEYSAKAQEVLGQVRGRDFRHEKTTKKCGSYRGGMIDLQSNSVKFNYSDKD